MRNHQTLLWFLSAQQAHVSSQILRKDYHGDGCACVVRLLSVHIQPKPLRKPSCLGVHQLLVEQHSTINNDSVRVTENILISSIGLLYVYKSVYIYSSDIVSFYNSPLSAILVAWKNEDAGLVRTVVGMVLSLLLCVFRGIRSCRV